MESVTAANYTVRTAAYEGPLELLLDLIEKRKLHVNELSLTEVTDDFIQHVRSQAEFPIEEASNFISVAATLLLIKSKSLIPELTLSEDEEEDVEDLKRRLVMYEKTREAAKALSQVFGRTILVSRGERAPEPMFAPSRDLSLEALQAALTNVLTSVEKQEELPEVRVRTLVTIEEMMDKLTERVQSALAVSFREFSGGAKEKVEVIVSFLALLELVKQGVVDAAQHDHFTDINITNTKPSTPRYG